MFKLIIFDFDGVLVLSNEAHEKAIRRAIGRAGIKKKVLKEDMVLHFGKPYRVVLRAVMGDEYTEEKLNLAYRYHHDIIHSGWFIRGIKPVPGLRKFLQKLREGGMKLAIATGNERPFLDRVLGYLNLRDTFDLTVCAEDVKNSKPFPDIILKAMEFFHVDRKETLFVGDAESDMLAAKRSGVTSVAVLSGVLNRDKAKRLKPDFIVDSVTDIYSIAVNR